jgi:hypothetical protein
LKHFATPEFWDAYQALPEAVRRLADKNYQLLKDNPRHPSVHLKRVGRFWSARVGLEFRAVAVEDAGDLIWFWIGRHSDYDRLIRRERP